MNRDAGKTRTNIAEGMRTGKREPGARPAAPRRRNATATRAAILASARKAFASAGYDGVGVREIAEGAGVTAMLVNRYFGSKEQLFAEVVADIMARPIILTDRTLSSPHIGEDIAAGLVDISAAGAEPLEGFRIMCYSASSGRAADIARRQIEAHYHKMLTAAARGAHAPQRAALVLAFVAGVQMMRQMVGLSALADCPPKVLVKLLAPVFQRLMDGEPAQDPKGGRRGGSRG
jgi:AcrR family transcriptional regulator